jgi:hypothetical protein
MAGTIIANSEDGRLISKLIDIILRTKNNDDDNKIKTSRFIYIGKMIFKGTINNRQEKCNRMNNNIILNSNLMTK